MAGYSAPGLLDGDYGYNSFWDNMSVGDMHELTLAPQHGDTGLVSALRMREQQNKELERQVKKYGEEEMAPALHAHDGMESSMMPGSETGIDGSACSDYSYGCTANNGAIISPMPTDSSATIKMGQIYCSVKAVEYHAAFISPMMPT